jgi:xanthine/CO dehydrogenase XdhC/CoxF family maturation factor
LVTMGFTDADLAHLHVSAGIRIGAVSPAEIIAILRYTGRT